MNMRFNNPTLHGEIDVLIEMLESIKLGYDICDRDSSHEAREDAYFVRAERNI